MKTGHDILSSQLEAICTETQTLASSFALVVLYIKTTFEETQETLLLLHKHTTDIYSVFTLKINKQSRKDPLGSSRNAEAGERHTRTV